MAELLSTPEARDLFLAQLEEIQRGRDRVLHVCDRLSAEDEAHLREQVRVLQTLIVELREVWADR